MHHGFSSKDSDAAIAGLTRILNGVIIGTLLFYALLLFKEFCSG